MHPVLETEALASPNKESASGRMSNGEPIQVLDARTGPSASRFSRLIPIILWLAIAAGVVIAVLQGWSRFTPRFQFPLIRETGTIFSEFDNALAQTGWNGPWRLVIWGLAGLTIVAGLAATGFALATPNDEPEALARDAE